MSEGTAPAWQVRDIQRQGLLIDLVTKILAEEERRTEVEQQMIIWTLELASFLAALLSAKAVGTETSFTSRFDNDLLHFFDVHILTSIETFSRSQEEADLMYLRLAEKLIDMGGYQLQAALSRQELFQPKLIFGVEDRTQEIPLPREQ